MNQLHPDSEHQPAPSAFVLHERDNVCVTTGPVRAGQVVRVGGLAITAQRDVALGAKLALRPIAAGAKVIKYGEPIGSATVEIRAGQYVHTHNLVSDYIATPHGAAGEG